MNKAYERINWENYPSENTALNEANLNKMDAALNEVDNRVVAHETTKLDKATANSMVKDVDFDETTGIFTITFLNGVTKTLDTKLEKIATNFHYDYATQKLILTLVDGTTQEIDMSALITQYEFENSAYIHWTVVNGKVKAEIINGSITADKLQPNFLADVTLQANSAKTSEQNAKTSEENAKQSEINAKNYADSAEPVASTANGLNPTLENSTDAPFISFKGDGKTTQAIEKYFIELTEVSGGVQTNIIDCKSGDEVVLDCGVARTIGYYVYLEDGLSMYEEGGANVQVYTFTAGGKMQFIIKGGTLGDNITITVNGSEYNNPSPDNPVPIHGVGENGVLEVKTTGANIFGGLPFAQAIVDNFNGTLNESEKTVSFTCSTALNDRTIKNGGFKENTQYTFILKGMCKDSSYKFSNLTIFYTDETNSGNLQFSTAGSISTGKFTSASGKTIKSIAFIYGSGGTIFNYEECGIFEGVINEEEFTSYKETTADIPLDAPLYEGDCIEYRACGSGKLVRKTVEFVFSSDTDVGTSGWSVQGSTETTQCFARQISSLSSALLVERNEISTHFAKVENAQQVNVEGTFSFNPNNRYSDFIYINVGFKTLGIDSTATSTEKLTALYAWFAKSPVTVRCDVPEPTVTPLTAEQIAEFEKLYSFDGTTHITCEAECEIDYFRDSVSGKAVAMVAKMVKNAN